MQSRQNTCQSRLPLSARSRAKKLVLHLRYATSVVQLDRKA